MGRWTTQSWRSNGLSELRGVREECRGEREEVGGEGGRKDGRAGLAIEHVWRWGRLGVAIGDWRKRVGVMKRETYP